MHWRICRHHPPILRRLVVLERGPDRESSPPRDGSLCWLSRVTKSEARESTGLAALPVKPSGPPQTLVSECSGGAVDSRRSGSAAPRRYRVRSSRWLTCCDHWVLRVRDQRSPTGALVSMSRPCANGRCRSQDEASLEYSTDARFPEPRFREGLLRVAAAGGTSAIASSFLGVGRGLCRTGSDEDCRLPNPYRRQRKQSKRRIPGEMIRAATRRCRCLSPDSDDAGAGHARTNAKLAQPSLRTGRCGDSYRKRAVDPDPDQHFPHQALSIVMLKRGTCTGVATRRPRLQLLSDSPKGIRPTSPRA